MNKNLKKVISSVVALTLSLSSVAAFAASFSDVPATANYASAVNNLTALSIIDGYEDGTFKPDNKVTRAEVTKMVVAALAQSSAAASAKTNTNFTDVTADHWAAGYINVGVNSTGFIVGMGDGTFQPESNVTYAQIVKMLVSSLGYGGMAVQAGGYPTGYMTIAEDRGITAGISGVNSSDEVSREVVARLINNALDTPLLVNTVWSATSPEYEIKDGTGKDYQTLLTKKHNAYKVEGRVTNTNKSSSGTVDPDEVDFQVEVAKNFNDEDEPYTKGKDNKQIITASLGDTDADKYLYTYASAIVQKDEDEDWTLLSFNASSKNTTNEFSVGAFDEDNKVYKDDAAKAVADGEILYFYATSAKSGKVSSYKQSDEVKYFINGVELDSLSASDVQKYLIDNTNGTVTIVDAPQDGASSTDGKYDYVFITYYQSGVVEEVTSANKINFKGGALPNFELDEDRVDDGDLTYHITLDGKEIALKDLQEDDVIAVAYDVQASTFKDSTFYEIIVTRGAVEGKVSALDGDEGYKIGDKYYKTIDFEGDDDTNLTIGTTYTLYVDAFGTIVDYEESTSAKKIAILENVWYLEGEEVHKVKVIDTDGNKKDYTLKTESDYDVLKKIVDRDNDGKKDDVQDRVVEFKSNASGEIYQVKVLDGKETIKGKYSEINNKIGSVKLSDSVKMLDATDYIDNGDDVVVTKPSTLVVDSEYSVYGFDKASDGTYRFVLVTEGIGGYTDDTQVAVFVKTSSTIDEEDDPATAMTVLYDGKEQDFILDEDNMGDDLSKGDVVVFKKNSSDRVTSIEVVFDNNLSSSYENFQEKLEDADPDNFYASLINLVSAWDPADSRDTDVEVVFGPIVNKSASKTMTIAQLNKNGISDEDEDETYSINSDTKVYVYDYTKSSKNRLYAGDLSDIVKTYIPSRAKDTDKGTIDWTHEEVAGVINYAFVKANDGAAEQVLIVISDND